MKAKERTKVSVLTFKSEEFKSFPPILREYASHTNTIKGNSEKTVCEYLLDLRTFFRFFKMRASGLELTREELEDMSISYVDIDTVRSVRTQDIIDYLMFTSVELGNSPSTRMRKISALKSFYHFLYSKRHYVDFNPTSDIDAPKKGKTVPKFLTLEEAVRLLEAVRNDTESKTAVRDFAIITLFLNTGMRLSELVGLKIKSFDSNIDTVKVLGKGNKERIIYLNSAARSAVIEYMKQRLDPKHIRTSSEAFFLSGRQTRISAKTVQWVVYKYLELAGLGDRGLSVHKLRHTAATLMFQSGRVDIRVIKDVLGHEQLNTTQIYTHVVAENLAEAVESNPLAEVKITRKARPNNNGEDDEE